MLHGKSASHSSFSVQHSAFDILHSALCADGGFVYSRWQRLLLTLYALVLGWWFRAGKVPLSKLSNLTRPGLPPTLHGVGDLHEFAQWWEQHTAWKADRFNGAFDILPDLANA